MKDLNQNEQAVLTAIAKHCFDDFSSSVVEVAEDTGISLASVKGYVGSLVKKGYVDAETEKRGGETFFDLWLLVGGQRVGFGCDQFDSVEDMLQQSIAA